MLQSLLFVINFFLMGMLSYQVRQRYIREGYCPTATGNAIMALCAFALGALHFLPSALNWLAPYVCLEILVIWLLITESYLKCFLEGHFYIHTRNMLNRFNVGTWVVGTSFLTMLAVKNFPDWYEITWILALVAIGVWIEYAHLFIEDLLAVSLKKINLKINGSIFLGSMSFQCMVLLLNTLLPDNFPIQLSVLFVIFGYLFYLWSFVLMVRSVIRNRLNHVFTDWSYVNSYVYGALAVCGLAALKIAVVPAAVIVTTCVIAMGLFLVIEGTCILKQFRKSKAEKKYDATQWSQVFSVSVLYLLIVLLAPFQIPYLKPIIHLTTHYGQYAVLALMVWTIGWFLKFNIKPPLKKIVPLSVKNQG